MRYTEKDGKQAFAQMVAAAKRSGVDVTGWVLQTGSPSAGRAWRVFREDERGGQASAFPGTDRGYIGWTPREACMFMDGVCNAFELLGGRA